MSKIIIAVLFALILIPFSVHAQESGSTSNNTIQTEVKKSEVPAKIQELKSKLVDEYGVDGFRFIKSGENKEGNLKNSKTLSAKDLSSTSGLDEYTIIIILAVIGAIAVILLIFK